MPMIYTRIYKVPNWVVLGKMPKGKQKKIINFLEENGGVKDVVWPAIGFGEYLLTFRKKGYFDHLPNFPFTLDPTLMLRAASEYVKKVVSPVSYLGSAFRVPAHHINRKVEKVEDLDNLMSTLLDLEDEIGLSQMFQVAEDCHSGSPKDKRFYVTKAPVPLKVLTKIANRVITIGDEPGSNLVTSDVEFNDLEQKLTEIFKGENV